jgi:hypothetical protein
MGLKRLGLKLKLMIGNGLPLILVATLGVIVVGLNVISLLKSNQNDSADSKRNTEIIQV